MSKIIPRSILSSLLFFFIGTAAAQALCADQDSTNSGPAAERNTQAAIARQASDFGFSGLEDMDLQVKGAIFSDTNDLRKALFVKWYLAKPNAPESEWPKSPKARAELWGTMRHYIDTVNGSVVDRKMGDTNKKLERLQQDVEREKFQREMGIR